MIKLKNSRCFSNAINLKVLSLTALMGIAFAAPGYAEDAVVLGSAEANTLLTQKPITSATLDYLHANGILIERSLDLISAPESAYRIVDGTAENHTFEYKTVDENGNVTTTYYTIELKNSKPSSESLNFGKSKNVTWTELTEQPAEDAKYTVTVKLSNDVVKYYQYSYTKPEGYEEVNEKLENPTGDIKDTVFKGIPKTSYGGAIYNYAESSGTATIGDITADFIRNSASFGGAIYNDTQSGNTTIGNITGDFIGNSAELNSGAIDNFAKSGAATIGDITGDFIGNSANNGNGGAIYNYAYNSAIATIDNITGDFIGNSANSDGGAIYNVAQEGTAKIGNITGDFIGNSATGTYSTNGGGAIYNSAGSNSSNVRIGNITGNFIGNSADSNGGAIYNNAFNSSSTATLANITGNFIGNSAGTNGGAISNYANTSSSTATIANITGDFIGNSTSGNDTDSGGGAIYNDHGTITNITGNFIGNSATGTKANGGAIYNDYLSTIEDIIGDFIGNSAGNYGGAIYNYGTTGYITGDFIGNSAGNYGGAIYNYGTTGYITGDFIGNSAGNIGGAISNYTNGTIKNITGDFIGNSADDVGAIHNVGTIDNITGDFIGNSATGRGGAIGTGSGKINNITGNFIGNTASNGGGIYNGLGFLSSIISNITGNFIGNSVSESGGAIYNNRGTIGNIKGDFIGNSAGTNGGAIYNLRPIENITGSFIGNSASQGGAIWTNNDLTFTADATESVFKDNYTENKGVRDDNAIYVSTATAKLTFNALNGGKFEMHDNIRGAEGYSVNITGDGTGSFGMYNDMYGANLSIGNVNLNTVNGVAHTYNLNSLTLTGDVNATVDVDLANEAMDRFAAASYGSHNGTLTVVGMNLLSDAAEDTTNILFADKDLKDNVASSVKEVAYSPIYKYDVSYDNTEDGGYFVFNRGAGAGGNSSDGYNPAVLSAPVSNIAAAQATVNETFKYVFEQADAFTQMPAMERQALIKANLYALSTDYNENLGSLNAITNNKAGWVRAYSTIENMDLRHGPKVDAITYGSLVGFDTDFHSHKDGWYSVGTGYVGYNGNLLSYNNVDTTMNGGLLGYTHTMYKNNFWSALTLTAGASVGESRTMYGKEDFTSLMAGLGSKTGYNFEFKEGKYIIQPIMFMSYTFANTFDYTNAAGVKIKPSPAHSIQLNPSVRFISNTKNGWQPYASIGMVWNVMNQNKVMANNVRLPEASMKPYVEYGLGVQRNWKDKFTAFGQAMVRNGGRNGIALTAGFRWTLGNAPTEKVKAPTTDRKVLKETKPKVVMDAK